MLLILHTISHDKHSYALLFFPPHKGQDTEIRNLPLLLAVAESHHRHLAALEFSSLAFLPCAPTPIADPYTAPTDKGSDQDKDKSSDKDQDKGSDQVKDKDKTLEKDKGSDKDKDKGLNKDKGLDQHEDQGIDKGSDQESLLTRILHKGVLGAFTTLTTDTTTAVPATTALAPTPASAPSLPAVAGSRSRLPLTLNNKGDEENSPVTPLAYHSSYIPSHHIYTPVIYLKKFKTPTYP